MSFKQIKRVAAVHDICGYGKCSLGIAIPVISAAGIEVCPVPTGVFSMHTAMDNWTMLDTTDTLDDYIEAWRKESVDINAVYSGFLSNKQQVFSILQLYVNYPNALKFVDPVMGDNGKLYKTYTKDMCNYMRKLIPHADYITPNITEAYILLNKDYNENPNEAEIIALLNGLQKMGAKNIVITGVIKDDYIYNYALTENGKTFYDKEKLMHFQIHGTGDLYCSCLLSALMNGLSLKESMKFSINFLKDAIKLTVKQNGFKHRGISFEPLLNKINFK